MIYVTINSGLGNQMFQYAAGFGLATRRETRLVIDRRFYLTHPGRAYELGRFALSARELSPADRLRLSVSAPPPTTWMPRSALRRLARTLPIRRVRFVCDREAGFDPAVLDLPDYTFLTGYWQNAGYFSHCTDALRQEFQFRAAPDAANAATLREIAAQPSVSVHVRRTDYLNPVEVLKPCGLDYYRRAFAHVSAAVPDARYFVFSDDPAWARANLQPPGPANFVTYNIGVNDPEDLRLMSACDHFVIANSSFSWWGAWLSKHPGKIVVAPRRWFSGEHGNERDIVPGDWLRL